jgi:hypothetical protein
LRNFHKRAFSFIQRRLYTNIMPSAMTIISYTLRRLLNQTYKEEWDRLFAILKFTCAHFQNPCTPKNNNSTNILARSNILKIHMSQEQMHYISPHIQTF